MEEDAAIAATPEAKDAKEGIHLNKLKLSKGLREFLKAITQAHLMTLQLLRTTLGVVIDTWLIPTEHVIVQQLRDLRELKDRSKGKSRDQRDQLPPPHLIFFDGMLMSLQKLGDSIGAKNLKIRTTLAAKLQEAQRQVSLLIRACKLTKRYDLAETRLSLALMETLDAPLIQSATDVMKSDENGLPMHFAQDISTCRTVLAKSFEQLDFRKGHGAPPTGALELLLSGAIADDG